MTAIVLFLLASHSLSAQSVSQRAAAIEVPDEVGYHLCALDDVDGDKCADFAVDDGSGNAWVISGKSGAALARGAGLPSALTTIGGDVDGDGIWDIAMWNPPSSSASRDGQGCALALRSGKDLHEIRRCPMPPDRTHLNGVACAAGDWDRDGTLDVALGIESVERGRVLVFSGATGGVLREVEASPKFGSGVRLAIADLDHDGAPDLLQGTRPGDRGLQPGRARVILQPPEPRSADARRPYSLERLALVLGPVPDADGDGWDDLLFGRVQNRYTPLLEPVTLMHSDLSGPFYRGLMIFSSRSGLPARAIPCEVAEHAEEISSALLDDVDRDGVRDFAVSYEGSLIGSAVVYSGKTGAVLREHFPAAWQGPHANISETGQFAASVFALGDTDADGVADYAIGASGGYEHHEAGCMSIYSGKTGSLRHALWKRDLVKK